MFSPILGQEVTEDTPDDTPVSHPEEEAPEEVPEEKHEEQIVATDTTIQTSEPEPQEADLGMKHAEREEKVDCKPAEDKAVNEQENKLGNWFNNEIRSRIQVTPKGLQLIIAG